MAKALLTITKRRGVSSSLIQINFSSIIFRMFVCGNLPKSADELLVADVTIAIGVVMAHEGLELDFLGEYSRAQRRSKLQITSKLNN